MNITQKRVKRVLLNMVDMVENHSNCEEYAEEFALELEIMLEDLLGQDAFGTEGQSDPRGDGREGRFSMNNVEGVE